MALSSRRSTLEVIAADTTATTTTVDLDGGVAMCSQHPATAIGVNARSYSCLGECWSSPRALLACMCIYGYVVFAWGLLRRSIFLMLQFSMPLLLHLVETIPLRR